MTTPECPFELKAEGPSIVLPRLRFRCYYCEFVSFNGSHHPWCGWRPVRIFEVVP